MKSGTEVGPGPDIFQRLLKERIVFIGSAIDQNTANLVCSQLILLEAENQERDISVYINSPGRLGHRRPGHLRHHAVRALRRADHLRGPGRVDGPVPAVRRHPRQAVRPAPQPDPDAPALGPDAGPGLRHRHPGRADHLPQADDGRADRLPHRPAGGADRGRLRSRPLVHRRGGPGVRLHRRGHPEGRHGRADSRSGVRSTSEPQRRRARVRRSPSAPRPSGGAPASSPGRATTGSPSSTARSSSASG